MREIAGQQRRAVMRSIKTVSSQGGHHLGPVLHPNAARALLLDMKAFPFKQIRPVAQAEAEAIEALIQCARSEKLILGRVNPSSGNIRLKQPFKTIDSLGSIGENGNDFPSNESPSDGKL